jgi:signal transduction histidine kinase
LEINIQIKEKILNDLFSKFILINKNTIKENQHIKNFTNTVFLRVFPLNEQIRSSENNESDNFLFNRTHINNDIFNLNNSNSDINNNNIYNDTINLIDILKDLTKENKNQDYYKLIGEFKFFYNKKYLPFLYWLKNINLNRLDRNINTNENELDIDPNLIKNIEKGNYKQPVYFLVYYRLVNGIIDIIINDNTSLKNIELDSLDNINKKKVLGKIAHEFKTPLNSIIGQIGKIKEKYIGIIKGGNFDPNEIKDNLLKDLDFIRYLSDYTGYLINDLMQFLGDEKDENINVDITKVNLKNIIQFSSEILNTLISLNENKKNNIKTFLKYDDFIDYLDVYSDEVRLNQIMLNLISNAVKFTKHGFISISCIYYDERKQILISVEDTGSGIKNEDKDLVFNENKERKIDLKYKDNKFGSGFGLKISYNISKKLNHILEFESIYGQGTIFSIKIFIEEFSIEKGKFLSIKENISKTPNIKPKRYKSSKDTQKKKNKIVINKKNSNNDYIQNLNEEFFDKTSYNSYVFIDERPIYSERKELIDNTIIRDFDLENDNENIRSLLPLLDQIDLDEQHVELNLFSNLGKTNKQNKYFSNFRPNNSQNPEIDSKYNMIDIINYESMPLNNEFNSNNNSRNRSFLNDSKNLIDFECKFKSSENSMASPKFDKKKLSISYCSFHQINNNSDSNIVFSPDSVFLNSNDCSIRIGKKKDFLIVDDNTMLRDSMVNTVKKYLEKTKINYEIKQGIDGKDLIRYVLDDDKNEIKFVITDENMELISGSLAVKFLREIEKKKLIKPKIYILASSDNQNFLENGFDYCINKPIKIEELEPIIKKHKYDKK